MTMVGSGPISLAGNATSPGVGNGSLIYSFTVQTFTGKVLTITGYDPALFLGQTIAPSNSTTLGGGTTITEIAWSSTQGLIVSVTGASNSGWSAVVINGYAFLRSAAVFTVGGIWKWAGATNPFPLAGIGVSVKFTGVAGVPITLNQSVEIELTSYYGNNPAGTTTITINDAPGRTLVGLPTPNTPISLSNFYGQSAPFTFSYTLANGNFAEDLVVTTQAYAAGWDGISPFAATITINGVLGSTSVTQYAFDTGTPPATSTIDLTVGGTGFITGMGGSQGTGSPSGTGGSAVKLRVGTTIHNSGIIQGGGGAGAYGDDGYNGGGAGYLIGAGFGGSPAAILQSGSGYAHDPSSKTKNGGAGGGWVAQSYAHSTNGRGNGSPGSGNNEGPLNGGAFPGHSIDGFSFVLGGSTIGTLRGPTTP